MNAPSTQAGRLAWMKSQWALGASALVLSILLPGLVGFPAQAEPYGSTPAERRYLAEVDQYLLRPRPTDVVMLKVGYQACQVRRGGGSSDDAKRVIWDTLEDGGSRHFGGAEVGSIVHVAVDNLCSEVGYP